MEILTEKILDFLSPQVNYDWGHGGYGESYISGCGCGDGGAAGSGTRHADGKGAGYSCGSGTRHGCGCVTRHGCCESDGYCHGFAPAMKIAGEVIWDVDGLYTVIREVHGDIAKGFVVDSDWSAHPCYIVKQDNRFAHGETLHEAFESLQNKLFEDYPEEVRVEKFRKAFPDFDRKIPAKDLFEWHNRLTGSCLMGRKSFARDHGIDVDKDSFTVHEFVELTKNAYGGNIIRMLIEREEEQHGLIGMPFAL